MDKRLDTHVTADVNFTIDGPTFADASALLAIGRLARLADARGELGIAKALREDIARLKAKIADDLRAEGRRTVSAIRDKRGRAK